MVRVVIRDAAGAATEIEAAVGESLMVSAKAAGIDGIEAECGGSMVCATCQVYVTPDWFDRLPAASPVESEMVEYTLHPQPNSRLSCQIIITREMEGLEVSTPPSQR